MTFLQAIGVFMAKKKKKNCSRDSRGYIFWSSNYSCTQSLKLLIHPNKGRDGYFTTPPPPQAGSYSSLSLSKLLNTLFETWFQRDGYHLKLDLEGSLSSKNKNISLGMHKWKNCIQDNYFTSLSSVSSKLSRCRQLGTPYHILQEYEWVKMYGSQPTFNS